METMAMDTVMAELNMLHGRIRRKLYVDLLNLRPFLMPGVLFNVGDGEGDLSRPELALLISLSLLVAFSTSSR
jgi:hypothetical protein